MSFYKAQFHNFKLPNESVTKLRKQIQKMRQNKSSQYSMYFLFFNDTLKIKQIKNE